MKIMMTYEELEEEINDIFRVLIEPIKDNLFELPEKGYITQQLFYTPVLETGFRGKFYYYAHNKFPEKNPKRFIIDFFMEVYDPVSRYFISREDFSRAIIYDQMAGILPPTLIEPNPLYKDNLYKLYLHLRAHRINYKEFLDGFRFALEPLFLEHL